MALLSERDAWLVLGCAPGVGAGGFYGLLERFGSASAALRGAADGRLGGQRTARGMPLTGEAAAAVVEAAREPQRTLARLAALGLWSLLPLDADYPARLLVLDPPPPVLLGWGDAAVLHAARSVAVVGTRRPTPAGRLLATRVAGRLVEAGAVVVSGLAVGIDGAAHAAVVEREGRTVAVIGTGHAQPGPRAHRRLVEAIVAGGGVVLSELAPDAPATKGTFPRRNRIISALADAVLVIEAPLRSGALITARHGLEQGRLVLAAPGRPGDPWTAGCLALLRETPARPLVGLDELLVDLDYMGGEGGRVQASRGAAASLAAGAALALLADPERRVAERLRRGPASHDALVAATGLAPGVVAAALTLLQLRGWAHASGPVHLPAGPLLR
ncbi:MAG TPA: DNA-processing protein DprA [Candidatus Limnocylindrales bacterium]|nr:DNA-processing protein DprA [Candidatus Limnocylindrales bacterium]